MAATSLKCLDPLNYNALKREGSDHKSKQSSAHGQWLCWQLSLKSQQRLRSSMLLRGRKRQETCQVVASWVVPCCWSTEKSHFFPAPLILGCLIMRLPQFHTSLLLETSSLVISLTAQLEPRQRLFYVPLLFYLQEQVPEQKFPGDRSAMYSPIKCKVPSSLFNPLHSSLQNFLSPN